MASSLKSMEAIKFALRGAVSSGELELNSVFQSKALHR